MEINRAYQHIEDGFSSCSHRPYKKSKKGDQIVLSFLTPEIGEHYQSTIDNLSEETGWSISINPEPNLYGIKQEVRLLIPESWGMKRDPAPIKTQRVVRVRVDELPDTHQVEEVAQHVPTTLQQLEATVTKLEEQFEANVTQLQASLQALDAAKK